MITIQLSEQEQSRCHCCGKQLAGTESAVETTKYYGQTSPNEAYTAKVLMPVCGECKNRKKKRGIIIWTIMVIFGLPPVISTIMRTESLSDLRTLILVGVLEVVVVQVVKRTVESANGYKSITDYPVHDILIKYKWVMSGYEFDEYRYVDGNTLRDMFAELESQGYLVEESPYNYE